MKALLRPRLLRVTDSSDANCLDCVSVVFQQFDSQKWNISVHGLEVAAELKRNATRQSRWQASRCEIDMAGFSSLILQ